MSATNVRFLKYAVELTQKYTDLVEMLPTLRRQGYLAKRTRPILDTLAQSQTLLTRSPLAGTDLVRAIEETHRELLRVDSQGIESWLHQEMGHAMRNLPL